MGHLVQFVARLGITKHLLIPFTDQRLQTLVQDAAKALLRAPPTRRAAAVHDAFYL